MLPVFATSFCGTEDPKTLWLQTTVSVISWGCSFACCFWLTVFDADSGLVSAGLLADLPSRRLLAWFAGVPTLGWRSQVVITGGSSVLTTRKLASPEQGTQDRARGKLQFFYDPGLQSHLCDSCSILLVTQISLNQWGVDSTRE